MSTTPEAFEQMKAQLIANGGSVGEPKNYGKKTCGKNSALASGIPHPRPEPKPLRSLDQGPSHEAPVLGRARICITRKSTGRLDRDNLWGSVKSLLDGLQKSEIIRGDSEDDIDLDVKQERVKTRAEQGTLIEIETAVEA